MSLKESLLRRWAGRNGPGGLLLLSCWVTWVPRAVDAVGRIRSCPCTVGVCAGWSWDHETTAHHWQDVWRGRVSLGELVDAAGFLGVLACGFCGPNLVLTHPLWKECILIVFAPREGTSSKETESISPFLSKAASVDRIRSAVLCWEWVLPFQTHPGDDSVWSSFLALGNNECVACCGADPRFLFKAAVSEVLCKCNAWKWLE